MNISEKEVLSLLEAQKLEYELQRAIDIENSRKEINEIKRILKREISRKDDDTAEDFIDSPIVPFQESPLDRFKSTILKIFGVRSYSAMTNLNTETISMYAVAKVVDCNSNKTWKTLTALACIAFISLQIEVMAYVIFESSWPGCSSMTDCPFGMYCKMHHGSHSTCADCSGFYNKTQKYEDMCPSQLGDENWEEMDLIEDFDHSELWVKHGLYHEKIMCYGFKHCSNTDLDVDTNFKGHCDFIALNKQKMEGRTWMSIIFLTLLWALPICQDIEEAALEEQVLDHYKEGSFSFPCEVVRIALRIRRYFLPLVTTTTTIALIVTDNMSAKNIILNFLTITFITESDNVLALLFLRKSQQELMEKVVEPIEIESLHELEVVVYWCRMQGIGCVFLLLFGIHYIQIFADDCENIQPKFWILIKFSFFGLVLCQGIYRLCFKKVDETVFLRIINTLMACCRNLAGASVPIMFIIFIDYFMFEDERFLNRFGKDKLYLLYSGSWLVLIGFYKLKRKYLEKNQYSRHDG